MAKTEPSKQNYADPNYPYWSWKNEDGTITYSVPLEAPDDETTDAPVEAEENQVFTMLRFKDGKPMRVHFVEITVEADAAIEQKKWLNTLHKREWKYAKRYALQKAYSEEGSLSSVWDRSPQMRRNDDGYTLADYSDLPDLIIAYIKEKLPTSDLYHQVYSLCVEGFTPKEIGEELGIEQEMVYFYRKEAYRVAQEYRKQFFDEGQYVFPRPVPKRRKEKSIAVEQEDQSIDDEDPAESEAAYDPEEGYDLISEPDPYGDDYEE